MRQSVAAFALICRQHEGQRQWLAQWNSHWQRYNFVGGHKREEETYRECVIREIEEELGLKEDGDIAVDGEPVTCLEYTAWSHGAQTHTHYSINVFWARLPTCEVEQTIAADSRNRWLDETELQARQTEDGKAVSETMWMVLQKANLVECHPPSATIEPPPLIVATDSAGATVKRKIGHSKAPPPATQGSDDSATRKGTTMNTELRHKTVAVAVLHDETQGRFLLWHNPRWHGYAFPMKKVEAESEMTAEQAALSACAEWNIDLPVAVHTPGEPAVLMSDIHYSVGARKLTSYEYHLIRIAIPGIDDSSLHPDLRFFTLEEIHDAQNVTSSTKSIAEWLVGDRHVAAAVVSRVGASGPEFLLTYTPEYQYFFPTTRLHHDTCTGEEVLRIVQTDLGYEGAIELVDQAQIDVVQQSSRYGQRQTRFHFHLCLLDFPGLDLTDYGNTLEQSLADVATSISSRNSWVTGPPYWGWFSEEEMRNRDDMSASISAVLNSALQLAEHNK